jgi:signal transduction histidine kinase
MTQSKSSFGIDETHSLIQAADTIVYCAMHQKRIVDDILTLSKLDSNLLEVSPQPAEPIDLVETALKMFESELKKLNMKLQLVVDRSLRDLHVHWLLFDSNRVLQVLINLMTNAVKFTRDSAHQREITVTLAASLEAPLDTDGDITYVPSMDKNLQTPNHVWCDWLPEETVYLSCNVSDTGRGITEKELKGLFHRFSQASPKTQVQ